jgi:hypothetical protein
MMIDDSKVIETRINIENTDTSESDPSLSSTAIQLDQNKDIIENVLIAMKSKLLSLYVNH